MWDGFNGVAKSTVTQGDLSTTNASVHVEWKNKEPAADNHNYDLHPSADYETTADGTDNWTPAGNLWTGSAKTGDQLCVETW